MADEKRKEELDLDKSREHDDDDDGTGLESSGGSQDLTKKPRTQTPSPTPTSRSAVPIMVAASPPKFMSLETIMKAAEGVSNMALAHEIAVDSEFKLQKTEQPKNSLEKQMKNMMHKAFWDVLSEKLREDPPDYSQALILLQEIKETLFSLLLPHHQKIKSYINEVLDMELIEQKADHGALDFHYYADFVISIMAKLCAPARDELVDNLKQIKEIVPLFREIFAVMEAMKVDMANYTIQQMRPLIQQQSIDYERQKFQEFMKKSKDNNIDGLQYTKQWIISTAHDLEESATSGSEASTSSPPTPSQILNEAYIQILHNPDKYLEIYPETLLMDKIRMKEISEKSLRIILISSILLVTYNTIGGPLAGIKDFKEKLKREIDIILGNSTISEAGDLMKNIAEHMNKEVVDCLGEHGFPALDSSKQELLKGQICDVISHNHPVHNIMKKRVLGFFKMLISSSNPRELQVPPGLSSISEELGQVAGQFLRLVSYNRSVFGIFYADIISAIVKKAEKVSS